MLNCLIRVFSFGGKSQLADADSQEKKSVGRCKILPIYQDNYCKNIA